MTTMGISRRTGGSVLAGLLATGLASGLGANLAFADDNDDRRPGARSLDVRDAVKGFVASIAGDDKSLKLDTKFGALMVHLTADTRFENDEHDSLTFAAFKALFAAANSATPKRHLRVKVRGAREGGRFVARLVRVEDHDDRDDRDHERKVVRTAGTFSDFTTSGDVRTFKVTRADGTSVVFTFTDKTWVCLRGTLNFPAGTPTVTVWHLANSTVARKIVVQTA